MPTRAAIDMPSPALQSARRLRRLAVELRGGGEDSTWLANCLQRYINEASRGLSIQEAFDLDPTLSGETWFQEERRDQRDVVLREIAQRFGQNTGRPGKHAKLNAAPCAMPGPLGASTGSATRCLSTTAAVNLNFCG